MPFPQRRFAALRALTAARVYLAGDIDLEQAAISHGSNTHYVRAGVILVRANDLRLIDAVLRGEILITTAAESVEPLLMLLEGYKKASAKIKDDFFVATGCTNDLAKLLITSPTAERTRAAERLDAETVRRRKAAKIIAAMLRGLTLNLTFTRTGSAFTLSDGTHVASEIAVAVINDTRIVSCMDGLLPALPQTWRYIDQST